MCSIEDKPAAVVVASYRSVSGNLVRFKTLVPPKSQGMQSDAPLTIGNPDTSVTDNDNMWYCFYYNVSKLMGLRYSPVLKQKPVQTSNSIQSYYTLEIINPSVLVFMYHFFMNH